MAGPDLSLITNAPNLTDRIMQQQQFSNQQGAAQIDLKTKQNVYASQLMSAAAASGDPQRIQMAKQALSQANIDSSSWADDPAQVKLQATALQQSLMSPLGMLNASINEQKANAATATNNGTLAPGLTPIGGSPAPTPQTTIPAASSNNPPALPAGDPTDDAATARALFAIQHPDLVSKGNTAPSVTSTIPVSGQSTLPPAPTQDDAKYAELNPKTRIEAFKADLEAYNQRPDVKAAVAGATSGATDSAKLNAEAKNAFNVMLGNIPSVVSRTNGIIQYAPDASSGMGVHSGGTEGGLYPTFANSSLGQKYEPETATANAQVTKYAAQGAFPEIAAALKGSSMKGNRFLEQIMSNGLSIDAQSPSDTKITSAQTNLGNYIQGVKSLASQLRAQGEQNVPNDQQIDAMFVKNGATLPKNFNTPQPGAAASVGNAIDPRAIQQLKANPKTAAQFDQIFGQGAAAKVLGQ